MLASELRLLPALLAALAAATPAALIVLLGASSPSYAAPGLMLLTPGSIAVCVVAWQVVAAVARSDRLPWRTVLMLAAIGSATTAILWSTLMLVFASGEPAATAYLAGFQAVLIAGLGILITTPSLAVWALVVRALLGNRVRSPRAR